MLHYEVEGNGPGLVLVHGFATNLYTWRHLRARLAGNYRLWLPDLKGFGDSPKPGHGRFGIYDHAAELVQFICEHDLRDLVLVGNSMGGALALAAAIYFQEQDPGRIRGLVLVDSAGYPQRLPFFMRVLRIPWLPELFAGLVPRRILVRLVLKRLYYDHALIPEQSVTAYSRPMDAAGGVHALIETARHVVPADLETVTDRYNDLRMPTMILWGREDRIVPLAVGERLHRAIAGSQLVVLDRCGHMPHEECPERALPIIEQFLEQYPPVVAV
jgi:pimeloyl-ACP methyl ester carboxylesterase